MDETRPASNIPEYSVGEIAGAVRRTLEGAFGRVRVRGEIAELRRYPSGHIYLALKDENAKLKAVIWKSAVSRLGLKPEEGTEVIASGRITTYGDRSEYQLQIDRLEYAGAGALLARIEALRQKLMAEGLFDEGRKRPIPRIPALIGVVSSEKGAVIQDIRTTIARRFPRPVLLWPVPVQGEGAAERIAAAIAGFSALAPDDPLRPDVVIVARGGGSLEDLMAFNEEIVVRAAAASTIPLISAVGHETDTTLIDFASDRRAPTPTAAAELAVPSRAELLETVAHSGARLASALGRTLSQSKLRLREAERHLPDLPALLRQARQRLDDRGERLANALPGFAAARRAMLERLASRLPHPRERIAAGRAAMSLATAKLAAEARSLLRDARTRTDALAARLEAVSYERVLARGFVLVEDARGQPVTQAATVKPGARLSLHFADGRRGVTADRGPAGQGTLL